MVDSPSKETGVASCAAATGAPTAASAAPAPVANARPTTPRRVMAPTGAMDGASSVSGMVACGITTWRTGLTVAPFSPMTRQSRPGEDPGRRGDGAPAIARPPDDAPSQLGERLTL